MGPTAYERGWADAAAAFNSGHTPLVAKIEAQLDDAFLAWMDNSRSANEYEQPWREGLVDGYCHALATLRNTNYGKERSAALDRFRRIQGVLP